MRLKTLAASIAFALFSTVASAQTVTVHQDGVTGDYDNIQAAVDAVLADPAVPDVVEILDVGPYIGPAVAINDTPVDGVQPFNVTDITLRGADGVQPMLVSTASSSTVNIDHVYGKVLLQNLILTAGVPNESPGSTVGPVRAVRWTASAAAQNATGRGLDLNFDNVVMTSSILTQVEPPIYVPLTTDGLTVAGVNAPLPEGDLCTFRSEATNIASASTALVNRIEMKNSVISAMPRALHGFRTFLDGADGSEIIIGPNVVVSHITGAPAAAGAAAGGIQVGGNEGSLHILKVQGTPEQPVIVHANRRGVDLTGSTPVGSIKSFQNMLISDSLEEGFIVRHPSENIILNNVTIVNSGQAELGPAEPFTQGPWPFEEWTGSLVTTNTIIAGDGSEAFRNLIRVVSNQDPPGFAEFTDGAIVLNGAFKLNTTDYNQDGFDGLGVSQITKTNILDGDPVFLSTDPTNPDFYRASSATYASADVSGAYGDYGAIPPSFVTVHSDGVSGDFADIQSAVNAVQGNPTGVGVVEILDEGPFIGTEVTISGGSLNEFILRGAPGVRPILAGVGGGPGGINSWATIRVSHFYGKVTLQNLLVTSAEPSLTENPVRAIWLQTGSGNQNTADAAIDYNIDDVIITSSVRTGTDPITIVPVTTDGITVAGVNAPLPTGDFCTIRAEAVRTDSSSSSYINKMVLQNSVISALTNSADGFRTFFDGAEGSEFVIGPNVLMSYIVGTSGSGAIQVGGNEGSSHILKVRGTPETPIILHGNRRGVSLTNTSLVGSLKSFSNVIISDSLEEGFRTGDLNESYIFNNVTIVNSGQDAGPDGAPAFAPTSLDWTGSLVATGSLFAGNGSEGANNVIRTATTGVPPGSALLQDGAIVLEGTYQLAGDGLDEADPSNVIDNNNLNGDPAFISTTLGDPDFYRPGAAAYVNAEVLGAYGMVPLPPAFATVHSDGVTGDFQNIQDAINSVMGAEATAGIVEILDEGPHVQGQINIPGGNLEEFTLRGAEGVRPIVAGSSAASVIDVNNFYGRVVIQNVLLTSATATSTRAIRFSTSGGNQVAANTPYDYLVDDVIITSSVRTQDDPIVLVPITTDGITLAGLNAPLPAGEFCTFTAETIRADSSASNQVNRTIVQNTIISGFPSVADGFRSFGDGAEGSELRIGPNVLISYLTGTGGAGGAIQVGGNEGVNHYLTVEGTPENPVILHNNYRGVYTTNTGFAPSTKVFRNLIISDSLNEGFLAGDLNENYVFENVTIANSGQDVALVDGAEAFRPTGTTWTGSVTATNTIFAGDGSTGSLNVINVFSDDAAPGTALLQDGAVVLNGSFRLTGDGIVDTDPTNVTLDNILNTDPQFISTTLGEAGFYRPGATDYINNDVLGAYGDTAVVPVELGDVNGDTLVNVADVTALAAAIAAGTQNELDPDAADVNGDTNIDEADVAALASMIVN